MDPYALAKRFKEELNWNIELQPFGFSNRFLFFWKDTDASAFFREFSSLEKLFDGITLMFISGYSENEKLVLTYIFKVPGQTTQAIFRFQVQRTGPEHLYEMPSFSARFPVSRIYENEISALFGTRFLGAQYSYSLLQVEEKEYSMREIESFSAHSGEYL